MAQKYFLFREFSARIVIYQVESLSNVELLSNVLQERTDVPLLSRQNDVLIVRRRHPRTNPGRHRQVPALR